MKKKETLIYFRRLEELFKTRRFKGVSSSDSPYPWMGQLEDIRLRLQNEPTGESWVDAQGLFFKNLLNRGFNPKSVCIVGTGKDAALIPNIKIFPNLEMARVVELEHDKIEGARSELERMEIDFKEIDFDFIRANASELPKFGHRFDLINSQLFEQHQSLVPPGFLTEEAKKDYPTFSKVLKGRINVLNPGGLLTTSDLLFDGEWGFEPAKGFEDDPEVKKIVQNAMNLIYGDKSRNAPGLIDFGWNFRRANPWKSREHLAETILENSGGELEFLPELTLSWRIDCSTPKNRFRMHTVVAYMVSMIVLANHIALKNYKNALEERPNDKNLEVAVENLEKGLEFLWEKVPEHIKTLQDDRIVFLLPSMQYLAFKKVN